MVPFSTPLSLLLGRLVSSWRTGNKVPHTTTSATDLVSWAREAESGLEAAPTQAEGPASGQAAASSTLQGEGPTPSPVVSPRELGSPHPVSHSPQRGRQCLSWTSSALCGPATSPGPALPPAPSCRAPAERTGQLRQPAGSRQRQKGSGRPGPVVGRGSRHTPGAPTCSSVASHSSHWLVRSVGSSPRARKKNLGGVEERRGWRLRGRPSSPPPHTRYSLADGVGGEEDGAAVQLQGGHPWRPQRGEGPLCRGEQARQARRPPPRGGDHRDRC